MVNHRTIMSAEDIEKRIRHLEKEGFKLYIRSSAEIEEYIIFRRESDEKEAEIRTYMGTVTFTLRSVPKESRCWCKTDVEDWEYVDYDQSEEHPEAHWVCKKCGKYAAKHDD